jgi:hypothetical protein
MTIEQAIQKAIEGGFGFYKYRQNILIKVAHHRIFPDISNVGIEITITEFDIYRKKTSLQRFEIEQFLLDPLFWQALGKAMGWDAIDALDADIITMPTWQSQWHRMIDHLADRGTIESLFEKL